MTTEFGTHQFWAIVPAAGTGSRMRADRPKQYLPLGRKTVIEHSLEALLAHPVIAGVVVALAEDDRYWNSLELAQDKRIIRVAGGVERQDSVLNALCWLEDNNYGNAWALVHDAARPCLQQQDIDSLVSAVHVTGDGAVLGAPVRDSLKRVDSCRRIVDVVDRSHCWQAFTPQVFPVAALALALRQCRDQGVPVTDEAMAMSRMGVNASMVEGCLSNIKITQPMDLALAERLLQEEL